MQSWNECVNDFKRRFNAFEASRRIARMDSHQRVWNAIDALATSAGLTPSGLAKAAGLDPTTFNRSKRIDARGRQHWPNAETIQKALDASGRTWSEFGHLVEAGPNALQREEGTDLT
jgi:hypothetical protein